MTVIRPNSVSGINSITVQSGNSLAIHKSNGELLRTITGTTGVSTFSSISVGTAYTDNSAAKSINVGVGASISQHDDNTLTFGTAGDPVAKFDASGHFLPNTDSQFNIGSNSVRFANGYFDTLYGDGSNLTGLSANSISQGNSTAEILDTGTNGIFRFIPESSEVFRITHEAKVGINTNNPSHNLDISADGVAFPSAAGSTLLRLRNSGGSATLSIDANAGNASAIQFGDTAAASRGAVLYNHSTDHLQFNTSDGTERLRIDSSGRVLIGNSSTNTQNIGDGTLQVFTSDRKHPAIRVNAGNSNGYTLFSDAYQADESQVNIGLSYSSSKLVLSTSVKPSDTTDDVYISSQDSFSAKPCALTINHQGVFTFLNTNTNATTTTDSAVSLSERFRITSTGRVGINTNSPDHLFEVMDGGASVATSRNGNNAQLLFKSNNVGQAGQFEISESSGGGVMIFSTKNTSGGVTESFRVNNDQTISTNGAGTPNSSILNLCKDGTTLTCRSFATGGYDSVFFRSANTNVGKIHFNSGGTQYHTSSDYRRKENVVGLTSAITRLKTLKPYRFNFKVDPSVTLDGFFAHEVTTVPEAISGTKDAVATAADVSAGISTYVGEPIYQTIDQSKLVPLLTAAIQEAVTKIETLETKVAALEGG